MPLGGRIPDSDHAGLRYQWTEVPNVPYKGPHPDLPRNVPRQTQAWWKALCALPHAILWTDSDWVVHQVTAMIHAEFIRTGRHSVELRRRESALGMTRDARLRLRIRYVDPAPKQAKTKAGPPPTDLAAERRKRLEQKGQ